MGSVSNGLSRMRTTRVDGLKLLQHPYKCLSSIIVLALQTFQPIIVSPCPLCENNNK
jgi:hypothetical protein